jgi:hypothetical protein
MPAYQHGAFGALSARSGPTGLHLSARSSLRLSLVSNASASPRFQLVVWGRPGKLGNPTSTRTGPYERQSQAAALLADSEETVHLACYQGTARAFSGGRGMFPFLVGQIFPTRALGLV